MTAWTILFATIPFWGSTYSLPIVGELGTGCSLSNARLEVPANQTQLIAPNASPNYIGLGVGTQNYTCNGTSYVLKGAVAELFDSSCLYGTPLFDTAPGLAYGIWEELSALTPQEVISGLGVARDPLVLGQHMFVLTANGFAPKWDFTSSGATAGDPNAYVIGAKVGVLPSNESSVNVDSLMVKGVEGELASLIFRVQNNGGQPPAGCGTEGGNITVKYTAQYWFFGGNIARNNTSPVPYRIS